MLSLCLGLLVIVFSWWFFGIRAAMTMGLLMLAGWLLGGLTGNEIGTKMVPNQGIRRSARYALLVGLGVWLSSGVASWLIVIPLFEQWIEGREGVEVHEGVGIALSVVVGLLTGLPVGMRLGGGACCQHLMLRLLLIRHSSMPWRYIDFLDYAAERLFLRKVGGGYIFTHRLLQDYFAARYSDLGEGPPHELTGQRPTAD
jgi:eukaryotic-like serine/threonine-protein kinase